MKTQKQKFDKTIVITRRLWGKYSLRDAHNMRCCLGFLCESYGVSPKISIEEGQIYDLPIKVRKNLPKWMSGIVFNDEASAINDSGILSFKQKETQLKVLFAKHGVRLVFRGKR